MRRYDLQRAVAVAVLGCAVGFQGACGGAARDVRAWQLHGDDDRPGLSGITVDRMKECMRDYAPQFSAEHNEIRAEVDVDENRNRTVMIDGVPETSPDFGSCVRLALRDMSINEELFSNGVKELHQKREQASVASRSMMSNPIVIVVAGVTIIVSEVMVEAGLYTVMVAVTVKVVEKASKDIEEEGWKAVCIAKYAACIAAVGTFKRGNHLGASRCATCLEKCKKEESWPSDIGNGSCEFWKPNWK